MAVRINKELPSPAELKKEYPLSDKLKNIKEKRDEMIKDVFAGKSDKFLVMVGPCSADNEDGGMRICKPSCERFQMKRCRRSC